jgi:hypothetical protein
MRLPFQSPYDWTSMVRFADVIVQFVEIDHESVVAL